MVGLLGCQCGTVSSLRLRVELHRLGYCESFQCNSCGCGNFQSRLLSTGISYPMQSSR